MRADQIKEMVKSRYAKAALQSKSCCGTGNSCCGGSGSLEDISRKSVTATRISIRYPRGRISGLAAAIPWHSPR